MPHTHQIDGKAVSYEDGRCPFCNPTAQQVTQKAPDEILPRTYRTSNTVVIKVSKVTMVTFNPYDVEKCWLLSIQRMKRNADGKVIIGQDQNPVWEQFTVRLPTSIVEGFQMEVSKLVNEKKNAGTTPVRE